MLTPTFKTGTGRSTEAEDTDHHAPSKHTRLLKFYFKNRWLRTVQLTHAIFFIRKLRYCYPPPGGGGYVMLSLLLSGTRTTQPTHRRVMKQIINMSGVRRMMVRIIIMFSPMKHELMSPPRTIKTVQLCSSACKDIDIQFSLFIKCLLQSRLPLLCVSELILGHHTNVSKTILYYNRH